MATTMTNTTTGTTTTSTGALTTDTDTIYVDTQHEDLVHDSQIDFYGTKLATCSSDRTIKIYNVSDTAYEIAATIQGHQGPVWQISWGHPKFGSILASCSFDGTIMVHKESLLQQQRMNTGGSSNTTVWNTIYHAQGLHNSSVNGIAFAPHEYSTSLMLATASSDGRVAILKHIPIHQTWSIEYIQDCTTGVNAVAWAPYGAYYNTNSMNNIALGTDPTVMNETLQAQPQLPRIVTAGCDNCLRFYVGNVNGEQWTMEHITPPPSSSSSLSMNGNSTTTSPVGHSDWVRDVAWAPCLLPNYNTVASCSEDRTVIIWTQESIVENDENTTTGTTTNGEWVGTVMHTFDEPVWRVSWSVTGHLLAVSSGDSNVTIWKATLHDRKKYIQVTTSDRSNAE